jgi:hypothetical protein
MHRNIEGPGVLATSLRSKIGFTSGEATERELVSSFFLVARFATLKAIASELQHLGIFHKAHSLRLCQQREFGRAIHVSLDHQKERLLPRSP